LRGNLHDQFLGEGGTATCSPLPDLYGRITQLQGSLASDFQYAGYYYHAPSGLSLAIHRAYSANQGRWICRDPIGENAGLNLYDYVANNPSAYSDPDGTATTREITNINWIWDWLRKFFKKPCTEDPPGGPPPPGGGNPGNGGKKGKGKDDPELPPPDPINCAQLIEEFLEDMELIKDPTWIQIRETQLINDLVAARCFQLWDPKIFKF
jgi:RHS repeat-associated protein